MANASFEINLFPTPSELPLVELREVTRCFGRGRQTITAIKDISFTVEAGQLFCLIGRSGSGKSTLLNLLAGYDRPTAGTLRIADYSLNSLASRRLEYYHREVIGFVFQQCHLVQNFTLLENVALPLRLQGLSRREAQHQAEAWLERVELVQRRNSYQSQLSGGEQQRAALVRAMIKQPTLLLIDEPTANLDATSAGIVLKLLAEARANRQTLIVATHDEHIWRLADNRLQL